MWDETAKVMEVIWVRMESEYFCKEGWTEGPNHWTGAGFDDVSPARCELSTVSSLPGLTRQSIIF
jgi:hypothetical protein